jgi:LAS superfamily LD-carboxypeptidase LdcB
MGIEALFGKKIDRRKFLQFTAGIAGEKILHLPNQQSTRSQNWIDFLEHSLTPAEIKAGLPIAKDQLLVRIVDKSHPITQAEIDTQIMPNLTVLSQNVNLIKCPNAPVIDPAVRIHQISLDSSVSLINSDWQAGFQLYVRSGFRTLWDQANLYQKSGPLYNSNEPSGASQHHTLAIDFTCPQAGFELNPKFEQTPEGIWMAGNAQTFGFVPAFDNHHDGIQKEPWHYVFVGKPLAVYYQSLKQRGWGGDIFDLQTLYPQK